jgi:hypothetical protein
MRARGYARSLQDRRDERKSRAPDPKTRVRDRRLGRPRRTAPAPKPLDSRKLYTIVAGLAARDDEPEEVSEKPMSSH